MLKWLHKIWNPHCPDCALDNQDRKVCQSCEVLTAQLAIANTEKRQLLEAILEPHKRTETQPAKEIDWKQIRQQQTTWAVRRQMLEAEDRKAAALMKDKANVQQQIADLEKNLGVEHAKSLRPSNQENFQPDSSKEVG